MLTCLTITTLYRKVSQLYQCHLIHITNVLFLLRSLRNPSYGLQLTSLFHHSYLPSPYADLIAKGD